MFYIYGRDGDLASRQEGGGITAMRAQDISRLERSATLAAKTLKSLSNRWRLIILCQLLQGEKSVGELLESLDLSQSALSQHLAVLRNAGLVATRREATNIYYSVSGPEAPTILSALYDVYCAPTALNGKTAAKG